MSEGKVAERLERILKESCEKEKLSDEQTNTIMALVEDIRTSGSVSSDHLVRIFDAIGGGQ